MENMEQPVGKESLFLKGMEEAVMKAGPIIRSTFKGTFEKSFKDSSGNYESLVTEGDTKSQDAIKETLLQACLGMGLTEDQVGFIGEEGLNKEGEHQFIVDPIDGTTNFAFGIPFVGVSIAYRHNGETQAGLIYDPLREVFYEAERGEGAFMKVGGERKKLEIAEKPLKDCLLEAHFNSGAIDSQFQLYQKLYPQMIAGVRSFGSLVLGLGFLAENKVNLVINGGAFVWDIAAAQLIVKEAGGKIVTPQGEEIEFDLTDPKKQYHLVAGHPNNVDQVVEIAKVL